MVAGSGPTGAPTVPVPVTAWSGATPVASLVPPFVTVSLTVIACPTLTVAGVAEMVADIDASAEPSTVKALCSMPEVPNGPCTRSAFAPGASPAGTVAESVWPSTRRTSCSGASPSQAWKVSSTSGEPPDDDWIVRTAKPSPRMGTGVVFAAKPRPGVIDEGAGAGKSAPPHPERVRTARRTEVERLAHIEPVPQETEEGEGQSTQRRQAGVPIQVALPSRKSQPGPRRGPRESEPLAAGAKPLSLVDGWPASCDRFETSAPPPPAVAQTIQRSANGVRHPTESRNGR